MRDRFKSQCYAKVVNQEKANDFLKQNLIGCDLSISIFCDSWKVKHFKSEKF